MYNYVYNRDGIIPGNDLFPGTGIPGNSEKNSREFPEIQNSLYRLIKLLHFSCKNGSFCIFWVFVIKLWSNSVKNTDFFQKWEFEKCHLFFGEKNTSFSKSQNRIKIDGKRPLNDIKHQISVITVHFELQFGWKWWKNGKILAFLEWDFPGIPEEKFPGTGMKIYGKFPGIPGREFPGTHP